MEVQSESPAKTGVTTPVSTQAARTAATPALLAKQAQDVVDEFQEWTVSGRRTSAAMIRFCGSFYIFEKDAEYAKDQTVKTNLVKALGLEPAKADQYLKRYRSIGAPAKELVKIQDSLPPVLECVYEVSKAFAPTKDTERTRILDAVNDKRLTVHSTLEDIRTIRNPQKEKPAPAHRTERRTGPSAVSTPRPESPTDEQIIKQAKAQGITSPEMQRNVVRQFRQAEAAESAKPTPTVVDATPYIKMPAEEPLPQTFRFEDMVFSEIKVDGTTVTGRFTINRAMPNDDRWRATLPPALLRAIQQAHL